MNFFKFSLFLLAFIVWGLLLSLYIYVEGVYKLLE
jgi:hypothetical protein